MAQYITMPKLGLTMQKGKISRWHVGEGMEFKTGDVLYTVETDKLTNDIEAKEKGFLIKQLVREGEEAQCLAPVAIIGDKDEDISGLLNNFGAGKSNEEMKKSDAEVRTLISPAARKLAEEMGINIEAELGPSPGRRITKQDILDYLDRKNLQKTDSPSSGHNGNRIPMTAMRKVIAERMTKSWHTSPVVHYNIRVDMTAARALKEELKDECKLTYTDILVKIVSRALIDFPLLNSTVEGEEIVIRDYVNMGVAVALDEGLIVPVVKNAHKKGLKEISDEIRQLAEKAKNNKLSPDEINGGTFTVTNIGMFGIENFTPIINQPEVAILGITAIVDTVVPKGPETAAKPLMNLSLTADHRVVDGAVAAGFLSHLKKMIEKPSILLL